MRRHKEVWKQKFQLIFVLIQLSEMHGAGRVKVSALTRYRNSLSDGQKKSESKFIKLMSDKFAIIV